LIRLPKRHSAQHFWLESYSGASVFSSRFLSIRFAANSSSGVSAHILQCLHAVKQPYICGRMSIYNLVTKVQYELRFSRSATGSSRSRRIGTSPQSRVAVKDSQVYDNIRDYC
jgi:hypothetical protein